MLYLCIRQHLLVFLDVSVRCGTRCHHSVTHNLSREQDSDVMLVTKAIKTKVTLKKKVQSSFLSPPHRGCERFCCCDNKCLQKNIGAQTNLCKVAIFELVDWSGGTIFAEQPVIRVGHAARPIQLLFLDVSHRGVFHKCHITFVFHQTSEKTKKKVPLFGHLHESARRRENSSLNEISLQNLSPECSVVIVVRLMTVALTIVRSWPNAQRTQIRQGAITRRIVVFVQCTCKDNFARCSTTWM